MAIQGQHQPAPSLLRTVKSCVKTRDQRPFFFPDVKCVIVQKVPRLSTIGVPLLEYNVGKCWSGEG